MTCRSCGAETGVMETRVAGGGIRRRRICKRRECGARMTTMEVPVPSDYMHHDGEIIVLARTRAAALRLAVRDLDALLSGETP